MRNRIFEIVLFGMLGAATFAAQVALSFLPNIEVVSILIIVYTCVYGVKALFPIYTFVGLEIIYWGFNTWNIMYLYVWAVLWAITMLFKRNNSAVIWAIINGAYGLTFGALCSITHGFFFGFNSGLAYFISGIPFDIIHCVGNVITALVLYHPIKYVLIKTTRQIQS